MKKYIFPFLAGILSTYPLVTSFHPPLLREYYGETTDYITANIYEILGEYNFSVLFAFLFIFILFLFIGQKGYSHLHLLFSTGGKYRIPYLVLSLFYGFTFTLGKYYTSLGTDLSFPGSFGNAVKFVLCTLGFALLCFPFLVFSKDYLLSHTGFLSKEEEDFGKVLPLDFGIKQTEAEKKMKIKGSLKGSKAPKKVKPAVPPPPPEPDRDSGDATVPSQLGIGGVPVAASRSFEKDSAVSEKDKLTQPAEKDTSDAKTKLKSVADISTPKDPPPAPAFTVHFGKTAETQSAPEQDTEQGTQREQKNKKKFWDRFAFGKALLLLSVFYIPFLIFSFPGNLCYDVIGQIEQVLNSAYSTHHPLVHTLIVGGLVELGERILHSPETGLFVYVSLQTMLLLFAFSATVYYFARRKCNPAILWSLLAIYALTPIYTNLATTAIKDIPFTACVVFYLILYAQILLNPKYLYRSTYHLLFVAAQLGVILMRNNGLPLLVICGLGAMIHLYKRQKSTWDLIRCSGLFFLESIFLSTVLVLFLSGGLNAAKGSKGEIFSLPFQQTAYYVRECRDSIPEEDKQSIEQVLGNLDVLADSYDPTIADPVKALYNQSSTLKDMSAYFIAYLRGGFKHPLIYGKAFLVHTYGWYCPTVSNEIRYETDYDKIASGVLFPGSDKILVFCYRFLTRIFPFGVMENVGLFVWLLAFITVYTVSERKKARITLLPLWISFLICLASPCFWGHPRYALPILAGLPFCFVIIQGHKAAE